MEKQLKKKWTTPTVECMTVKSSTLTGWRRGRSRSKKGNKSLQVPPDLDS